ncbi:MAG: hypothetical protein HY706_01335 [Candidatus Hydrogenedentes bacterium]|nr:hypothetical protein [Candidatus Hydrogenedentota bacterium]
MKLRIKDNAVRFRLTLKEAETLERDRELYSYTDFPGSDPARPVRFRYGIKVSDAAATGAIQCADNGITATLPAAGLKELLDPAQEGVYYRFEVGTPAPERFMFFVEKDRPGSTCDKPELWIYEEVGGKVAATQPAAR